MLRSIHSAKWTAALKADGIEVRLCSLKGTLYDWDLREILMKN